MSKQRLEEITDAFAAGFQAGADAARRECAGIAATFFGPAHTYSSENAEIYRAQDVLLKRIADKILSRVGQPVEGEK